MTFRQTVLLGFVALSLVLAAITAGVALDRGRARIEGSINESFEKAPERLEQLLGEETRELDVTGNTWANDPQLRSLLGLASSADSFDGTVSPENLRTAHDKLVGLTVLAGTTWASLKATNDNGTLLLDQRKQEAFGEDLSADPLVKRALAGQSSMRLRNDLIEMARPLSTEGVVRGTMIAGKYVQPMLNRAADVMGGEVTLGTKPDALGTTRSEVDGELWLTRSVPLKPPGGGEPIAWVRLSRSVTRELRPQLKALLDGIGFATAVGIAFAVLASLWLSRSLSAPVSKLVSAAKKIGAGDLEHRVQIAGKGELATLGQTFNEMAAGLKQRVFFESALRRYLAGPVVDQLVKDPSRMRLGGERREVSILFFDVAGFTTLAEQLTAVELVALVNGYLDNIVEAIFRQQGTFDKFIGDAVMCFWGAPLDQPDHAALACKAAVEMQAALRAFTQAHASPKVQALHARVGIHTGPAALGNLGSSQVMSYTAMGDSVNLASRLEGLNKQYGTAILVSEDTFAAAKPANAREIDRVRVKGRAAPVGVFELYDPAKAPAAALARYAEGLAHYRARRFTEAVAAFDAARTAGDGACAEKMSSRAKELLAHPPGPDWDGAFTATEK
ncbi:MAG: adenylate/guanylate cyclase domain-containing protein [Myxococcaceae bacterium]